MVLSLRYIVYPDLDSIMDELEREATVGIIHNCECYLVIRYIEHEFIHVTVPGFCCSWTDTS
jgi:hypothetical protein